MTTTQSTTNYIVSNTTLRFRAQPVVNDTNVIATLHACDKVTWLANGEGSWIKAQILLKGKATVGYCSRDYLVPDELTTEAQLWDDDAEDILTDAQLLKIMGSCPKDRRATFLPHLRQCMFDFKITNPLRKAAFLAQIAHESGQLRYMEEIADGSAYEGRADLGNTQTGDGKRYKGRGAIQITGRSNYRLYGQLLNADLEGNPPLAAQLPYAIRTATLFWKNNGLNECADYKLFTTITKKINGGTNGLEDREKYYKLALAAFNAPVNFADDKKEDPGDISQLPFFPRGAEWEVTHERHD